MLRVQKIESIDDPRLLPYRTLKQQRDHHQRGIFVAEGEKIVHRLLQSRLEVLSVALPPKWLADFDGLLRGRPEDLDVFVVEKEELEKLTGFSMYQGLLAVGRIPESPRLEAALAAAARPYFLVAADGINNSENMGGLVRNAAAFGAHALLVGETSSSPYLRRAVRSSMGTIFRLPAVELPSLAAALRALRSVGVRSIAAHPHADQRTLYDVDFTTDCCVVFGSEGFGLPPEVLEACDDAVAIPMAPEVDSLNVGSAAAAFLAEVQRQRLRSVRPH